MRIFAFATAAAALLLGPLPAVADVIVLAARGAATLKAGDTLGDSATIDLPAGASADVLLPSGAIRTLQGPGKVAVQSLTRGEKADAGLFEKVAGIVTKPGASESSVGAVRSVAPARPRPAVRFSWTDVPVDAEGDWCLDKGVAPSLARQASDRAQTLIIVDVAASQRAEVTFQAGEARTRWPDALPPKVGAFAILMPDRPMRQIRLRLISPVPNRDETLRILHSQRCEAQMQAFLTEVLLANR